MYIYKLSIGLSFGLLSASVIAVNNEVGIRGGYQIYNNHAHSPTTFGGGVFMNTSLFDKWSLEMGVLHLGEAEEDNRNLGAFNVVELSALYHFDLPYDQALFVKGGGAPWFGYMTMPTGEQRYQYGVAPAFGLGYHFPIYANVNGRLEYQFFPNLGGDDIGYTDSHFLSLALSWRKATTPIVEEAPLPDVADQAAQSSTLSEQSLQSVGHASPVLRSLYGVWLFEQNSSQLKVPTPFSSLDSARHLIEQGCRLTSIDVTGYSDNSGDRGYNQWLSEQRASKVADYLARATNYQDAVLVSAHGSERFAQGSASHPASYERRVDFNLDFQCWEKESNE